MNFTPLTTHLAAFLEPSSSRHINIDGASLSLPDVIAVARRKASTALDQSTRARVQASRDVLQEKLDAQVSIYGVSTGFGGSASTRTQDHLGLGLALFQMQHCGIMSAGPDLLSTTMPEPWVRAAILVRINSLIRGHSGVRWELPQALQRLLAEDITPLVPLRGSISASGDLSPLSYIAGTLMGNPSIRAYHTCPHTNQRTLAPSHIALANHNISPLVIQAKEHLGLLNGTAFSAAVASLALYDAVQLTFLTQVCTAMATEALLGSRGSFMPFVNEIARPHPGQTDVARTVLALLNGSKLARTPQSDTHVQEDKGTLKQDRYALRTSPQFIGPQVEDIHSALLAVTQELNSTTDNPLIESATRTVHDTGNFQAMAVTNAMEKTRLALHHLGKILFAQTTEMMNPDTSKGLTPSLAATDPSLNFHCKGVEISLAAYVSELGFLANPVSTHIQSAEMHNQAVNSLALLSARQTITAADVLTLMIASCIYSSCQALDLRALQFSLVEGFQQIITRTTCYFWTKEPLSFDSPKEEDGFETTPARSGKDSIGRGGGADEPKARNSLLDSDQFLFLSHSHEHDYTPISPISPGTSSPPMGMLIDIPLGTRSAEATEKAGVHNSTPHGRLEPVQAAADASCGDDLIIRDLDLLLDSHETTPALQLEPDVNFNDANMTSSESTMSTSEAGDTNSTSSDDDDEESAVEPSYGSSLTSMTSMTSMASLSGNASSGISDSFIRELEKTFSDTFWHNTAMDAEEQVRTAVDSLVNRLVQEALRSGNTNSITTANANPNANTNSNANANANSGSGSEFSIDLFSLRSILPAYRASLERACLDLIRRERKRFLTCPVEDLPTPGLVGLGSRRIHRFVRKELGIRMHGSENLVTFEGGLNYQEATTGEKISLIYDAIRNGGIQPVLREIISDLAL